jgi:hypothetical protein
VQDSALAICRLWISRFLEVRLGRNSPIVTRKKAGAISAPAFQLVCARIKLFVELCSFRPQLLT